MPCQCGQGVTVLDPEEAQHLQAGLIGNLAITQGTLGTPPVPSAMAGQPKSSTGSKGTQPLPLKVSLEPMLLAALKDMVREQSEEKDLLANMAHQGKQRPQDVTTF